ncbi:NAD(P)H-hydrate dehydratase [Paracoccus sp. 1_MG-2023]|nr:NAD(P)H-hydrate dehydratase [Paracoccus sp. 1_MG-2023]MDO6667716.1 NAD(P)H-hydrate dehydratase [Paracoccus sp. 1_MG-2023]
MRAIESDAMNSGQTSGAELMERAGAAVAGQIRLRWPKPGRVTVLAGPGNNGGDGFVVARHLARAGWAVRVMCDAPRPSAALTAWQAVGSVQPFDPDALRPDDLHVDAIFGTGLTRAPEGMAARMIEALAGFPGIVAIDAPSGLCLDSGRIIGSGAARAALTVAFDSPKPGHVLADGPRLCGRLVVADIGLAPWRKAQGHSDTSIMDARTTTGMGDWLRKTTAGDAHKYGHGSALVIAGDAAGAARLTAKGALRAGAGLVTICPERRDMQGHAGPPDALMRKPLDGPDDLAALLDGRVTALGLGPGAGMERAANLLPAALGARITTILDADALTALAGDDAPAPHDRCILTPHLGEFARLFPDLAKRLKDAPETGPAFSKLDATRQAAARIGAVVLLKGPDTVIAEPSGRAVIHSAPDLPWLATAGAGDTLAGIVTGLAARGLAPFDAACLGVMLHGAAARHFGPGLIADDLADALPHVIRTWET